MNRITLIGSLIVALGFTSCQQTANNSNQSTIEEETNQKDIEYQIMVQRATQTAIWAMPGVALVDFIKATRRDLDGDYNDVLYLTEPFDSKHGFLTANDVTAYAWSNISISNGPIVVEVPAASEKVSYFGSFVNAWFQPIEDVGPAGADKGKGGKYVLVPPGYTDIIPEGYIVLDFDSYDVAFAFRPRLYNGATDADAAEYAQTIKVYNLSDANNPPLNKYIHVNPHAFNSLPTYDETFFQDIDHLIQSNPIRPQDKAMVSLLKGLGIEKGKAFTPNEEQNKAMNEGLKMAYDYMQYLFSTPGQAIKPLWEGKNNWYFWNFAEGQPQAGFPYETDQEILIDGRAGAYFYVTYLPRYLGGGTFYLTGLRDNNGELYNGEDSYVLNVPANTPVKDFWSVIVYSMETKGFIVGNDVLGLSSRDTESMQINEDGSYDVYLGPKAPEGKESNWIPTGEDFFLLFRLYGPTTKDFYKSWMLGDVEKIK